jgi:hypothetical protein
MSKSWVECEQWLPHALALEATFASSGVPDPGILEHMQSCRRLQMRIGGSSQKDIGEKLRIAKVPLGKTIQARDGIREGLEDVRQGESLGEGLLFLIFFFSLPLFLAWSASWTGEPAIGSSVRACYDFFELSG